VAGRGHDGIGGCDAGLVHSRAVVARLHRLPVCLESLGQRGPVVPVPAKARDEDGETRIKQYRHVRTGPNRRKTTCARRGDRRRRDRLQKTGADGSGRYVSVDWGILWRVVTCDLPPLAEALERIVPLDEA
jgi:hypothetical protein